MTEKNHDRPLAVDFEGSQELIADKTIEQGLRLCAEASEPDFLAFARVALPDALRALVVARENEELQRRRANYFEAEMTPAEESMPREPASLEPLVPKDADLTRPPQESVILDRAITMANAFGQGLDIETMTPEEAADLGSDQTLSAALAITLRDMFAALGRGIDRDERPTRCGWCIDAAGGDDEAEKHAAVFTITAMRSHLLVCPNHPLSRLVAAARAFAASPQSSALPDAMLALDAFDTDVAETMDPDHRARLAAIVSETCVRWKSPPEAGALIDAVRDVNWPDARS